MAQHIGPNIVTDGLKNLWDAGDLASYPGSGTTWSDLAPGGLNGTLDSEGLGTSNPGSMTFAGTTGADNVGFGDHTEWDGLNKISVAMWIKVGDAIGAHVSIFSKDNIIECWMNYNSDGPYISINNNAQKVNTSSLGTGNTAHIVWTADISGTDTRYFYLNGKLNGSSTSGTQSSSTLNNTGDHFHLAGRSYTYDFKGQIYHVAVYSKALSATEVLQNYNAHRTRFGI